MEKNNLKNRNKICKKIASIVKSVHQNETIVPKGFFDKHQKR